jgi:hypothetical protein
MPLLGTRGAASARGFGLFGPIPGDPFFSSTTLLLPGNGTNGAQNNTFLDSSTNAFSITRNGNTTQGTFSPFPLAFGTAYSAAANGGSGYFDGSGDYLDVANGSALDLDTTFTVDAWFYQPTAGTGTIFSRGGGAANWSLTNGYQYNLMVFSGLLYWQWNVAGSAFSITATAPAAGAWHHVAVGYNGTTTRVWLNGASIGTSTNSYSLPTTRNITRAGISPVGTEPFTGYISSFRMVKGTDVYGVGNTSITVPTAPLTAITNTSLLLNFTNAGVLDATAKNDLETVGNAQISTAQSKWGGASIAFDGTGDYLPAPSSVNFSLSGDFTIEGWVYRAASGQFRLLTIGDAIGTSGIEIYPSGAGAGNWTVYSNNATRITGSTATREVWTHLAVVRSGSTVTLYINGTASGSTWTTSATFSGACYVGAEFYNSTITADTNGYIDDLRITKGVARYTANFTAPTAAFPLY